MATSGHGHFPLCTFVMALNNFSSETSGQKWKWFGRYGYRWPSSKKAKRNLIRRKTWWLGGVAYHGKANFKSLLLELVVRIQNNLVEMITGWPSTKELKKFDPSKTGHWGAWPVSLMYLCKKLETSSPLKPVVRIENGLVEIVIRWPDTKLARSVKNMASFP